ncbi:uncharacterized protein LOC143624427 [Bidens hawaiensis]|uniref:uncharacterized protein LOC143624427 n=1 Tax=Bidens hawaiensis TaxID=980011 RepID=UPI00404A4F0A
MEIAAAIISPVVESLAGQPKKHLGFLLSSTKYAKDIQAKVTELEAAADDMLDKLHSNKANRKVIPYRVPLWLEKVEEIKSMVGHGIPRGRFRFLNMKTMYTAGRKSFRILKEIDRLMMEQKEMHWIDLIPLGMVISPRPSTSAAVFEHVLTHPPQYLFCNLKALHMYNCVRLTYLFTKITAESLRKLETLEISSCPILTSVVNGENSEVGVITFHKLKVMVLHNLPELVSFCQHVHAMELLELVELQLDELPIITSVFPGNISSSKQPMFNKEVVIPNLDKLTISSMTSMKDIWPYESMSGEEEVNNIFMLRTIIVKDCNGFVNLFPSIPNRLSSNLERLRVEKCGSIEALFNIDTGKKINYYGHLICGF